MTPEEIQAEVQAFLRRRPQGLARWMPAVVATAEPRQDLQAACESWEKHGDSFAAEWVEEAARKLMAAWMEAEDAWTASGRPGSPEE